MTVRAGRLVPLMLCALAGLLVGCTTPSPSRSATHTVHVKSVSIDPRTSSPVVLLEEADGERRRLPIWIGPFEAQSIALAMEQVSVPRPNTHDLIKNLMDEMRVQIERVVITELRDNTYYAVLDLVLGGRRLSVDSRPSDAIAVAIRTGAPLFATDAVLRREESSPDDAENALEIFWERQPSGIDATEIETH